MLQVGIDIGGTNIKAGIVDDETGKILVKRSIPFLHGGYEKNCAAIAALVLAMEEELTCRALRWCFSRQKYGSTYYNRHRHWRRVGS